jgi:hypothetical protein
LIELAQAADLEDVLAGGSARGNGHREIIARPPG